MVPRFPPNPTCRTRPSAGPTEGRHKIWATLRGFELGLMPNVWFFYL